MRRMILVLVSVAALFFDAPAHGKQGINKDVVKDILKQGEVACGVHFSLPGFSAETAPGSGVFEGFDADYCKAIAAAIFGDPTAVRFVPVSAGERFAALVDGDIDVLIRTTTHTFTRDAFLPDLETGVHFAPTTFYDGQGFMTDETEVDIDNVAALLSFLEGRSVCVPQNTTSEQNLEDLNAGAGYIFAIVATVGPSHNEYDEGECDVMSTDKSALAAQRGLLSNRPSSEVLGVTISKEPLGPVTSYGDQPWSDIVDWVVYATYFAEEHGITQANVDVFVPSTSEEARFLGVSGDLGAALGLSPDWAKQVIGAVGNYGEIYDQYLVPIGLARSQLNRSHVDGGLLYSPPFR